MTQNIGLNQAQLDFLRLLSHFTTEDEVKELNDVVCEYYAKKVDEEMDKLWDEGKWSEEKIEETRVSVGFLTKDNRPLFTRNTPSPFL